MNEITHIVQALRAEKWVFTLAILQCSHITYKQIMFMECLLLARHCFKHFLYICSFLQKSLRMWLRVKISELGFWIRLLTPKPLLQSWYLNPCSLSLMLAQNPKLRAFHGSWPSNSFCGLVVQKQDAIKSANKFYIHYETHPNIPQKGLFDSKRNR